MNILLFSDPHFTDNAIELYRWNIFDKLEQTIHEYSIDEVFCLGDVVDRKDNHSRFLINKLVECFSHLQAFGTKNVSILAGNHDAPTTGPYYWKFLNGLGINYIQEPKLYKGIYLLPFTANPQQKWAKLDFSTAKAIFMHETVEGSLIEDDRILHGYLLDQLLPVSANAPVFSGDIHRPQTTGGVTYVGVPHPTKYSETWDNRFIAIDNSDFTHPKDVWIKGIKRAIIDISSTKELQKLKFTSGDQLRIRYHLSGKSLNAWPDEQIAIRQWANKNGIFLASVEANLSGSAVQADTEKAQKLEMLNPKQMVKTFGRDEKLSQPVIDMGIEIVEGI